MRRGDVVLVPIPFQDKPGEKVRPAIVVQSDAENTRLANTVLATVPENLRDAGRPTTLSIDPLFVSSICNRELAGVLLCRR